MEKGGFEPPFRYIQEIKCDYFCVNTENLFELDFITSFSISRNASRMITATTKNNSCGKTTSEIVNIETIRKILNISVIRDFLLVSIDDFIFPLILL